MPSVALGTLKIGLTHQYNSLFAIVGIFIFNQVVTTLTDEGLTNSEKEVLMGLYATVLLAPLTVSHYLAYKGAFRGVDGTLKKHLQVLLLKVRPPRARTTSTARA